MQQMGKHSVDLIYLESKSVPFRKSIGPASAFCRAPGPTLVRMAEAGHIAGERTVK
jgi:hypothetical protein